MVPSCMTLSFNRDCSPEQNLSKRSFGTARVIFTILISHKDQSSWTCRVLVQYAPETPIATHLYTNEYVNSPYNPVSVL